MLYLSEKGTDMAFGARPLRRQITKDVEDALSEEILKGKIKKGDVIHVHVGDNALTFEKTGARELKKAEDRTPEFMLEEEAEAAEERNRPDRQVPKEDTPGSDTEGWTSQWGSEE